MCIHYGPLCLEVLTLATVTLDVLPLNGDVVAVLLAVAGMGCATSPTTAGWLRVAFEAPEDAASTALEAVVARLAPVSVRIVLQEAEPALV